MPAVFFLIVILLEGTVVLGHWVIYLFVSDIFSVNNLDLDLGLKVGFLLMSLLFLGAQILVSQVNNIFSRTAYKILAVWMGLFVYLLFAALIWSVFGKIPGQFAFFLAIIMTVYGIWHANQLTVMEIRVKLPNLPGSWQGKKIVFISDNHLGQIRNIRSLNNALKIINYFRPEIILHAGDFFDGVKTNLEELAAAFGGGQQSRHGIYFVTGNHESFTDSSIYTTPLRRAGIKVLSNEVVELDGLQIIGIDYATTEKEEEYKNVLSKLTIDPSKPSILLKHVPSMIKETEMKKITFQLSGHSHRGQLWPFRYITSTIFKGFDYGLKRFGNLQVYTTSGAGTWGPPLRTFTDSEIVVIELWNE